MDMAADEVAAFAVAASEPWAEQLLPGRTERVRTVR
jgi:putative membrane protein